MIRIQRDRPDESGVSIRPPASWFEEAGRLCELAKREGARHRPQRRVYGHRHVRAALEKLFHGKCAYCESRITPGFDWEVEHFRPKRSVAERPDHPGYYWLAYEWTNLFPSCTLCNQRRRDRPSWGNRSLADNAGSSGGKGDRFPVMDESTRALSPAHDLARETPLLLEPCCDDPDDFLTFDLSGAVLSLEDNVRGAATIEVFHLQRKRLRDLRRGTIEVVVGLLTLFSTRGPEISPDARRDLEAWVERHYLGDDCCYAAVARSVLRDPAAFGAVSS